jgi:hypothetical protein
MPEEICHHCSEWTNRDTRFARDAKIGMTGYYPLFIFFKRISRTNAYTWSIFTPPAGKSERGQFPYGFKSI